MSDLVPFLANVATALGIPIAIGVFLFERHRDRRDRELETYRALSDKYFEYLTIQFNDPKYSTTETVWSRSYDRNADPRQDLLVQMAVNLIETAFYLYQGHRSEFRRSQWAGWDAYLRDWCAHPAFIARWPEVVDQYDAGFREEVRRIYEEVNGSPAEGKQDPSLPS